MQKFIDNIKEEVGNYEFVYDIVYNLTYLDITLDENHDVNFVEDVIVNMKKCLIDSERDKLNNYVENIIETSGVNINFKINKKDINVSKLILQNNNLFFINELEFNIKLNYKVACEFLKKNNINIEDKGKVVNLTIIFKKK